ncbi:MAG: hypothetical protein R2819_10470 [Allomuricauda sp.]
MKKLFTLLPMLCLAATTFHAQDKCSKFYPFVEGAIFTHTLYDQDGTAQGKVTYEVDQVTGNSGRYTYSMSMGGTVISSSQYTITCTDDGVSMDLSSMRGGMLSRFANAETNISGTNLYIPNDLSEASVLPDATMELTMSGAPSGMNMSMRMTHRKVVGTEFLTDPNGVSRKCFILTYDTIMNRGTSSSSHTKQWLTEGIGLMKTEEYDRDGGTLRGKTVLTSYQL